MGGVLSGVEISAEPSRAAHGTWNPRIDFGAFPHGLLTQIWETLRNRPASR